MIPHSFCRGRFGPTAPTLRRPRLAFVVGAVLSATPALALEAGQPADTIFINARIYTLDTERSWPEALAIRDNVIVAVGDANEVQRLQGVDTRVEDLGGDTVLPGLHDVHVHPLFSGLRENECSIPQGSNGPEIQKIVKACVDDAAPGEWIYGGQWDSSAIGRPPSRELLDVVSPDNAVLLYDTSGHSAVANSRALELAGIDEDSQDPDGGIIERDRDGLPTGVLREAAIQLVRSHLPAPTDEAVRQALASSLDTMLSYGITSFTEAAVGFAAGYEKELSAYAALADAGELKQRVRLCLNWEPGHAEADAFIAVRNLYARDRVATDCVKIFLDGVPTEGHTAAMLEAYAGTVQDRSDQASVRGMLLVEPSVLNEAVTRFDRNGLKVKFHAAGDAAVRAGLDAIEAARRNNGFSGQLHDVGHCTFVARDDLPRARRIGATFEVSPYLWSPSPINDSIAAAVGEERIRRAWPVREMLDAGALVVPGSDWAVVPSVSPWIALEILVTRSSPGEEGGETFGAPQAITLEEGLELFTVNAARHEGAADKLGRIETGMLADLVVVDRDPLAIPITEVHKVGVKRTYIDGELVYERPSDGE